MDPSLLALILAFGVMAGVIAVGGPWYRSAGRAFGTLASLALGVGFAAAGMHQDMLATQRAAAALFVVKTDLAHTTSDLQSTSATLDATRHDLSRAEREAERVRLDRRRLKLMLANAEADLERRTAMAVVSVEERIRLANQVGSAILSRDVAERRAESAESKNAELSENLEVTGEALNGADARLIESEEARSHQEQLMAVLKADRERLKAALKVTEATLTESQAFEQVAQNKVEQLQRKVASLESDLLNAAQLPAVIERETAPSAAPPMPDVAAVPVEPVTVEAAPVVEIVAEVTEAPDQTNEPRWIVVEDGEEEPEVVSDLSREVTEDTARRSIERTLLLDARARGRYAAALSLGRNRFDAVLLAQGNDEAARAAIRAFGAERTNALIAELGG